MSAQDQTSVFEMRRMADMSGFRSTASELIRAEAFEQFPHRDYDRLSAAVEEADSVKDAAHKLDTARHQLKNWCDVYGLEPPRGQSELARRLSNMDPSEASG